MKSLQGLNQGGKYMKQLMAVIAKNPIFRRWVYITFLSVVSIVIIYVVEDKLSILGRSARFSASWPLMLKYAVLSLLIYIISLAVQRLGGIHPNFRFKIMMRYPPFWFAILIALTFFGVVKIPKIDSIRTSLIDIIPYVIAVFVGVILTFASDIFSHMSCARLVEQSIGSKADYSKKGIFVSDEELMAWILEERPITSPQEDIFGHAITARRISQLLLTKSTPSIGILGPYGTGKSSVINLVEYYFNHKDEIMKNAGVKSEYFKGQVICCRIDGWGQNSGFVAQRILYLAIEQLKRHVDCTSLVGLPESYRKALAGSSWGIAFISAIFQSSYDPVVQLAKLDDILSAAGLRLVIFLEDLDRNIGDEIMRDELPALLDRLRVLAQISFVLAIGTDRNYSNILIRICDHVEVVA